MSKTKKILISSAFSLLLVIVGIVTINIGHSFAANVPPGCYSIDGPRFSATPSKTQRVYTQITCPTNVKYIQWGPPYKEYNSPQSGKCYAHTPGDGGSDLMDTEHEGQYNGSWCDTIKDQINSGAAIVHLLSSAPSGGGGTQAVNCLNPSGLNEKQITTCIKEGGNFTQLYCNVQTYSKYQKECNDAGITAPVSSALDPSSQPSTSIPSIPKCTSNFRDCQLSGAQILTAINNWCKGAQDDTQIKACQTALSNDVNTNNGVYTLKPHSDWYNYLGFCPDYGGSDGYSQCSATIAQYLQAKGFVPSPSTRQPDDCSNADYSGSHPDDCTLTKQIIVPIINVLSAAVGIVVVLSVVIAGIQYITANGNPQSVAAAKGRLGKASLALVVYIFGFALLQWLIPGGIFH